MTNVMQSKLSSNCCLNQTRGHIYHAVSYSNRAMVTQVFIYFLFLIVMGTFSFASEHYIVINIVIFAPLLFRKHINPCYSEIRKSRPALKRDSGVPFMSKSFI